MIIIRLIEEEMIYTVFYSTKFYDFTVIFTVSILRYLLADSVYLKYQLVNNWHAVYAAMIFYFNCEDFYDYYSSKECIFVDVF